MKRFTRIESSAGGGKTSEIVKRYIELIKKGIKFDRILAITFTNKASEEMKRRILKNLKELALSDDAFIFKVLDGKEGIIDNFSDFSLKTIDAFLFSLLKSCALDLKIPPEPEIEEKEREKIKMIIDEVLAQVANDSFLKNKILNFLNFISGISQSLNPYENFIDYFSSFLDKERILGENYEFLGGNLKDFFLLIKKNLEEKKKKEGFIFLSDISILVFNYVKNSDVPYLFFKLGEKFYHFLVDEFQDTSIIQWKSLKPLVENALSGMDPEGNKGTFFYVGDPKQSIYRWRGTRWELFDDIIKEFEGKIEEKDFEFIYKDINKRSLKNIIDFVNDIFDIENLKNYFAKISDKKKNYIKYFFEVERVYKNVKQKPDNNKNSGGYIEFKVIKGSKSESEDEILFYLKEIIDDLLKNRKRSYGDIAILERQNNDCQKIVNFLLAEGYPVYTSYDVSIENLPLIRTIIYFFKILVNENDRNSFFNLIQTEFFSKIFEVDEKIIKKFLLSDKRDLKEFFKISPLFEKTYKYFKDLSKIYSPYYLLLEFDYVFKISEKFSKEYLHLLSLLKGTCEELENISIYEFVKKFEKFPYLFSPSSKDAINVLTIHKAKGLEFNIVISLFSSFFEFEERDKFIIYDKDIENPRIYLKKECDDETKLYNETLNIIQELNLLYVALTRAKEEIYFVICDNNNKKNYGHFILDFLKRNFGERKFYKIGEKVEVERKSYEKEELIFYRRNPISIKELKNKLFVRSEFESEILNHDELLRGEWIHLVLSNIKNLNELNFDKEIEKSFERAKSIWKRYGSFDEISFEKVIYFKTKIKKEFLREFFFTDKKIRTEFEVVNERGEVYRIDRIVFGDTIKVIEFKTGNEKYNSHFLQVKNYLNIIKKIFGEKVRGYLIYLDREEVYEI